VHVLKMAIFESSVFGDGAKYKADSPATVAS
jgi:hypothetical protein